MNNDCSVVSSQPLVMVVYFNGTSAIEQRPRCRVGQLWPIVEDCNWETLFYGHLSSTTVT